MKGYFGLFFYEPLSMLYFIFLLLTIIFRDKMAIPTYIILMTVVYFIGKKCGEALLYKLWDFWKDVYAERITDMARFRYDNSNVQHTVVYDVDTMFS